MAESDTHHRAKLPLLASVFEAFELTSSKLVDLAKLTWLWLIILIAIQAVIYWYLWPFEQALESSAALPFGAIVLGSSVISTFIGASIAVGWHRLLLENEHVAGSVNLRLDGHVWRYFAWVFGMLIAITIPIVVAWLVAAPTSDDVDAPLTWGDLSLVVAFFVSLLILSVAARAMVILPGVALGHETTLGEVWKRTRGNTWRIFTGSMLTAMPIIVIALALSSMFGSLDASLTLTAYVIENTILEVVFIIAGMFGLSFLSLAYRHFFGPIANAPQSPE